MASPLVYFCLTSLDGFITDADGRFDWAVPDPEVHTFVNELFGDSRTHLYGRRMHEVMRAWDELDPDTLPEAEREFALQWRDVDKIVYSTTLSSVSSPRTELRASFDADEVRRLKESLDHPLSIGGGGIASEAARAGLLDEVHLVLAPVFVGRGTRFLAEDVRLDLALEAERRFGNGFVYLGYRVVPSARGVDSA